MDRDTTLEKLRRAIEAISEETTSGILDPVREQHKAPLRAKALNLLNHRARSRYELRERLLAAGIVADAEELVDEVLDDLERSRLLDDAVFASEWVRQRHERRGKSRAVLDRELREKGVSQAHRQQALAQVDDEDEESRARAVATKKARSIRAIPSDRMERDKLLRRIVGVLARRGFPQAMSLRIARNVLDERLAELEDLEAP